MKGPFFLSPDKMKLRRSPWGGPALWLVVHLAILLLLLLSIFIIGPVRINTMLFDMLPRPGSSKAVMEADMIFGEKNSREVIILAAAEDFEKAKNAAALLSAEYEQSPDFENSTLYFDPSVMAEFSRYLYDYRFVIAGKETLALLENGEADELAADALAWAFGALNFAPLDNIENDPFLLVQRRMGEWLSSSTLAGGMSLKDDVLAARKDGIWYVLLRLTLAPQAVSLRADQNTIGKIYAAASSIKESVPELEFYFSGIPFHSYESSLGAQREISLISVITLFIILVLFFYIFRSLLPVFLSVLAAMVSLAFAAGTVLLIFREIHIITFVFGTTLIGTCVDYSVHFFVHWKGNPALKDGFQIRNYISKSIIMCFVSTEISFFIFLFAPFPIMKQFAVFSMAGLLSSFLTSFCIYPRLKIPEKRNGVKAYVRAIGTLSAVRGKKSRITLAAFLSIAALTLLAFNYSGVKIENNLSSLYTMSSSLMESEKRAALILDHGSRGWYFIVSGSNSEETLQNEERLVMRLEKEIARGNLESIMGTSVFVPSKKTQTKTYEAMKELLPLSPAQFEYLGFPPEYAESFVREFAAAERYCLPDDAPSRAGISNLWIGERGGNWYSCVLPVKPGDEAVFSSIAGEFDYVHFVNKSKDIGRDMDILTGTMLRFFLAAYIAVSVLCCFVYPWQDSLKICMVPLFVTLVLMAVLSAIKVPLGFFSAAALVLIFGLGLDYIFYMTGNKHAESKNLTLLAIMLSFLTTFLSFGALAFSSFMPVHLFGLSVSIGLSAAFIIAMLLQGKDP